MRKSSRVTLVLIGITALAGCGADDTRRDVYRTRDDCLADWGNRPQDCAPSTDPKHHGMGYFIGPAYAYRSGAGSLGWSDDSSGGGSSSRSSSRSVGSTAVSRGGFGSSGHSS